MIGFLGISLDKLSKPDIDLGRFGTKRVWAMRRGGFEPFRSDRLPVNFEDSDLVLSKTEPYREVQGIKTLTINPFPASAC